MIYPSLETHIYIDSNRVREQSMGDDDTKSIKEREVSKAVRQGKRR
jgi:hypothetical protein